MPAQNKIEGGPRRSPRIKGIAINSHSTGGKDPFGDAVKTINGYLHDISTLPTNLGPKPGQMASNQYLRDHGAGSILKNKKK